MVLKCPNCGQQLRGEPGASGTCPKCKTKLTFPQGDPMLGEPVKCVHCGQQQRYKDGFCINCGKKINEAEPVVDTSKPRAHPVRAKGNPLKSIIVACVILFLLVQCGKMIGKGDGSSCYVCGKPAVYTTSSGYGLCGKHLIEGLDYNKR